MLPERPLELLGTVEPAEAAPEHEIGTRRDGRGRFVLHEREPPHGVEEVDRARRVEELGTHRDATRLLPGQPVRFGHVTIFPGPAAKGQCWRTIAYPSIEGDDPQGSGFEKRPVGGPQ